jgi:hypothetical protein
VGPEKFIKLKVEPALLILLKNKTGSLSHLTKFLENMKMGHKTKKVENQWMSP